MTHSILLEPPRDPQEVRLTHSTVLEPPPSTDPQEVRLTHPTVLQHPPVPDPQEVRLTHSSFPYSFFSESKERHQFCYPFSNLLPLTTHYLESVLFLSLLVLTKAVKVKGNLGRIFLPNYRYRSNAGSRIGTGIVVACANVSQLD